MKNKARSKLADVLADIKNGKSQLPPRAKTPQVNQTAVAKVAKPTPTPKNKTKVLKLFNRCVDLAQFDGRKEPPLYPVCRAWLHGFEFNKPTDNEEERNNQQTSNQDNSQSDSSNNEIHNLPIPKSKKETIETLKLEIDDEDVDLRIPKSVRNFKPVLDIEETFDKAVGTMNQQQCMDSNRLRWKRVKNEWSEARKIHEYRYEESFKALCS